MATSRWNVTNHLQLFFCAVALVGWVSTNAQAQDLPPGHPPLGKATDIKREASPAPSQAGGGFAQHLPADSVTQHTITLDGKPFAYKATAGTLPLLGPQGDVAAKMFYVAYQAANAPARPTTFVFNGGPGAASAFLHIAALGPRIVPFAENGAAPLRPVRFVDNPATWLAFTDLVFIDPVGTGYSRATGGGDDKEAAFWGDEKDANSVAAFIRGWLSRNGRSLAPVYLAGESYGGLRAAILAEKLLDAGLDVQGAVLISPALDFPLLRGNRFNVLPLAFDLPSLAVAAAELKDGTKTTVDNIAREAEAFAATDYLVHVARGRVPSEAITARVSQLTGLSPEIVARNQSRAPDDVFFDEYERATNRRLSRYDATVSAPLPMPAKNDRFDVILDGASSVLAPAAATYIAQDLGFRTDLDYRLLNETANRRWSGDRKRAHEASGVELIERARTQNPALKVFIAHGYTDLVTPYALSRYLIGQLRPIEGAAPVELHVYRGGHMMYFRGASREALTRDVRRMYETSQR
ncbi:S10 family peptidase [Rhodomicrobium lacus]|uniref:S10 family peptidase n=1 Tax=Rhodomicrobium lacus TaxID=2498452 RepID=UPI0026E2E223|nr:peptidase S10 [Rhodomicrobium lacus]WKW50767.1 peptidase S10 [Rhodomicrobium lacus]